MTSITNPVATRSDGITITVDTTLCYGFGDCVDTLPEVFELDSENIAQVIDPDAATLDELIESSQNCPVDAIIITAADGSQIYP